MIKPSAIALNPCETMLRRKFLSFLHVLPTFPTANIDPGNTRDVRSRFITYSAEDLKGFKRSILSLQSSKKNTEIEMANCGKLSTAEADECMKAAYESMISGYEAQIADRQRKIKDGGYWKSYRV